MNSPVTQPLNKNNGSSLHIEDNELLTGIQRATSQNLGLWHAGQGHAMEQEGTSGSLKQCLQITLTL